MLFAREGTKVAITYLDEDEDAKETHSLIKKEGQDCLCIKGDLGTEDMCRRAVSQVVDTFGRVDVLVNNAAEQHPQESLEDIIAEQLERTFRTNIFAYFCVAKAALPHMGEGSLIINTTSVTAYKGSKNQLDYLSTKGAIVAFTRSLSQSLVSRGIRVNAVAPGPIWTPLIPSTFSEEKVRTFLDLWQQGPNAPPPEARGVRAVGFLPRLQHRLVLHHRPGSSPQPPIVNG